MTKIKTSQTQNTLTTMKSILTSIEVIIKIKDPTILKSKLMMINKMTVMANKISKLKTRISAITKDNS